VTAPQLVRSLCCTGECMAGHMLGAHATVRSLPASHTGISCSHQVHMLQAEHQITAQLMTMPPCCCH
jgi:hypothetical protein